MPTLLDRLGGLGDEAGHAIVEQVIAIRDLRWSMLELRTVEGTHVADLDDRAFTFVRRALDGIEVPVVSTRIGSWERPVSGCFERDLAELETLAGRARALGARFLRVMSYPNDGLASDVWAREVQRRMRRLAGEAARHDVVLLHENCAGWGGLSPAHTVELIRAVDSPHLRLLFDVGNPVAVGASPVAWLASALPWVRHVHLKDAQRRGGEVIFTWPGRGDAQLAECIRMLAASSYSGAISIEPHLHFLPHLGRSATPETLHESFVQYGRSLVALVRSMDTAGQARHE